MPEVVPMPPSPRRRGRRPDLQSQIARRATNEVKILEAQARRNAIGEIIAEKLEELIGLLVVAGFTVKKVAVPPPAAAISAPPLAAMPAPPPAVTNPCALCGQAATHRNSLPNGQSQLLCRNHANQYARENAGEEVARSLMGQTTTYFQRAKPPPDPSKRIVDHPPTPEVGNTAGMFGPFDLLKGAPPPPPPNGVLDDD